jgi:hypothetical protein
VNFVRKHINIIVAIVLIVFGYILIHDLAGGTLLQHAPHDSYTLQAKAWLNGDVYLRDGQNYGWLELAIFHGKYYVSFPPLPTVPMIPLVLIFGEDTPNNILVALYTIIAFIGVYAAFRIKKTDQTHSVFWAVLIIFATNMMEISTYGGVWLQAQTLNMALLVWGVYFAIKQKRTMSLIMFALAVGCRPFSIWYIPVALLYFLWTDEDLKIKNYIVPIFSALLIGAAYAWYNYIRFGNPIEFGHNYLPEFTNSDNGQFHISYLWNNLRNIFMRPVKILPSGELDFPMFDGFMFYVANPIFIVWLVRFIKDIIKKNITLPMVTICVGLVINLICLCLHKTFGGWGFGARYTLDLVPYVLFYLLLSGNNRPNILTKALCGFGLLFNTYGMLFMRLYDKLN